MILYYNCEVNKLLSTLYTIPKILYLQCRLQKSLPISVKVCDYLIDNPWKRSSSLTSRFYSYTRWMPRWQSTRMYVYSFCSQIASSISGAPNSTFMCAAIRNICAVPDKISAQWQGHNGYQVWEGVSASVRGSRCEWECECECECEYTQMSSGCFRLAGARLRNHFVSGSRFLSGAEITSCGWSGRKGERGQSCWPVAVAACTTTSVQPSQAYPAKGCCRKPTQGAVPRRRRGWPHVPHSERKAWLSGGVCVWGSVCVCLCRGHTQILQQITRVIHLRGVAFQTERTTLRMNNISNSCVTPCSGSSLPLLLLLLLPLTSLCQNGKWQNGK